MATQVLILAAGRGSRLGPNTTELPKPLLQIGPRYLVEHQLETYAEAGVGPVGMVVGYQAEEIAEVVGIRAEYIVNSRWATTNSLYSFLQAREWVDGDLIIANCDLLFHPDVLERLLDEGGDAFAFDSGSGHGREHMKVSLEGSHLRRMSKSMAPEEVDGENVGLLYLKAETVDLLFQTAARLVDEGHTKEWLGIAVQEVAALRPLKAVDVTGLPWAEIDFAYDLDRARKEVWPEIRSPRAPRRRRTIATLAAVPLLVFGTLALGVLNLSGSGIAQGHAIDQGGSPNWDTVELQGSRITTIDDGQRRQRWWLVEPGGAVEVELQGPREVQIDSRVLMPDPLLDPVYRLEVYVDGQLHRWQQHEAEASTVVRHEGVPVSWPHRRTVQIPDGLVTLRIAASSIGQVPCFVRVRQIEDDFYAVESRD